MNGGQVIEKYVSRLADFSATEFEAIFNCTGLGSKRLCNDNKMVPIRGQIMKGVFWFLTKQYSG